MKYTKADLEELVLLQLANLEAMNELVNTMRRQNSLIEKANIALKDDIEKFRKKQYIFAARKRTRKARPATEALKPL
ncbi:hypothetical protein [Dyadobacter luticola]|uniref:Uncharacterized protein n=1 Tax=Dyadobacter luticola TaxID=1979387 RepID=A0A5R9KRK7_9BACT|nr:hypothetical protein [Dyadobacter luticola]TLU98850.1 hypothetical protein FEN17_19845 [Dyadobacter luticola]